MSSVRGRVKDGKLEPDGPLPPEWTEGAVFQAKTEAAVDADAFAEWGMREEDWPTTPEGIEAWCAWLNSREPVLATDSEVDQLQQVLAEQKAWQKAQWSKWTKEVEDLSR